MNRQRSPAGHRRAHDQVEGVRVDAADAAWLAVVPTAVLTVLAVIVLGPPLGRLLPASHLHFWSEVVADVRPEPTEQARYLVALGAPLLLSGCTVLLVRHVAISARAAAAAAAVEIVAVLALAVCFVLQRVLRAQDADGPVPYFGVASILVAFAVAGAIVALARVPRLRERCERAFAETRARRGGVLAAAFAAVLVTVLPAINTDGSILAAHEQVLFHLQFIYDEAMAVLDGRSPLSDFATQYGALLPYGLAATMSLLGKSVAVFSVLLAAMTGGAMLALFAVLRRLARSSVAGLLLFLPLLATSALRLRGESVARFSLVNYFGVQPLRYAGPFVLAWLLVRHLDGLHPRRLWPLFLAGGLLALNNADFGLPALGATTLGLLWADTAPRRRMLAEAAAGLAAALAAVVVLLLVRTGAPPHFPLGLRYAELFTRAGFGMFPIRPLLGLSTVMFMTYVATFGLATVRALRGEADRALTGMLVWSGGFGLGAGAYYVGRSRAEQLYYMFPAWALALALLTIVAVRWLATTERRPTPAVVACLVGFGLLVPPLVQTPAPWAQVKRIAAHHAPIFQTPPGQTFVAQATERGERVVILSLLGHQIAHNLGLVDVETYTGDRSVQTAEQFEESLRALRKERGTKVFVWAEGIPAGVFAILSRGFAPAGQATDSPLQLWIAREG
ncbi:MAG: hypothetical protein ACJ76L_05725 [Conexibacter sp.]